MELKIGHRNYNIVQEEDPRGADNEQCSGTINEATEIIKLRLSNTIVMNVETLIHEAIHGIDYFMGLDLAEGEVLKLGAMLATIAVDNTNILDIVPVPFSNLTKVHLPDRSIRYSRLKIGWNTFEIVYMNGVYNGENEKCYSRVDYINSRILVDKQVSRNQRLASLLFNVLAILDDQFGIATTMETRARLSQGLATVIVDNPSIFIMKWRDANEKN